MNHWRQGDDMKPSWSLGLLIPMFLATPFLKVCAQEDARRARGEAVIAELSGGAGQPLLATLHEDFPFLAAATADYALGDVWGRGTLDIRTRQLAAIAAFAAQGNLPQLKVHAGYALKHGVAADELKEVIYLTTVTAGFPRALDAALALREVFASQPAAPVIDD